MSQSSPRPVALVTGAAGGIGRACCSALAERGFDVLAQDLAATDLATTVEAVAGAGGQVAPLTGDIADLDQHRRLLDEGEARFGRLDCLVNNAGVSVLNRGDLLDVSIESYDRCQAVNTRGAFFLTRAFARRLLAAPAPETAIHRSIVFITSVNADAVSINRGEYCISKAGLSMVAKLFAVRLAEVGIGVYEIRPGVIRTTMTEPSKERYERMFASGQVPVPRWGEPAEVARAVATVASGALPYTVGTAIGVDGGLGLRTL
jgi:NAD(P)-dependent dehydrogenase (short-subunit alcohol dehydrogenase family)